MKIVVLTPVWKRPKVTEIWALGLNRIKKIKGLTVEPIAVVSPSDDTNNKEILDKYNIEYIEYENILGAKKNFGLQYCLKKRFDYLMELNSDDVVKNKLFDYYLPMMKNKVPFIGLRNFAFVDGKNKTAKHHKLNSKMTFGIARAYRKDILKATAYTQEVQCHTSIVGPTVYYKAGQHYEIPLKKYEEYSHVFDAIGKPNYKLWKDDAMRGMDNESEARLSRAGINAECVDTIEPLALDIKTDVNIWSYKQMPGTGMPFDSALSGLSKKEIELINGLD